MQTDRTTEAVTITTADGFELGGTLYRVAGAEKVVIVHGATAVPHQFYRYFGEYFQRKGWSVLTYDFRGLGVSGPESLVGFRGRASDWGLLDMPAALQWVTDHLHPLKICFVGHSAGGQQAGLLARPDAVDAMVTVSSQSGYWRYQGGLEKIKVLLIMTLIVPVLVRLYGYLPWSKIAAGVDIPKGAALEWASWCRSSLYLFRDKSLPLERYQNFKAPILAYSIEDDAWGTARSVDAMMRAYPNVQRRHLVPAEYGLKKIGHMGFFRAGSEALWDEAYDWLSLQSGD